MSSLQEIEHDIGGCVGAENAGLSHIGGFADLRQEGRCWSEIRAELLARKAEDYDWRAGRLPLYVYHDTDELLSVAREAYNIYFTENALGRRAFPSLVRMEEQIVRACLSLFRAPADADGSFTTGGTESIFLALKTARDQFRTTHAPERRPNVVVPRTAHPAFDKAGQYLGVGVTRVRIGGDLRVDVDALRSAIDENTMMIVGSAPCYPYGVFDSIPVLAEIAAHQRLWLHVDACLGGFLAPFARDEGYAVPDFDFSVGGVTSLSADLHKHGFAARGASVVLYSPASLKAHQAFRFNDWPRGTYSTETFPGSRPGGAVASAWAVLQFLGRAGYQRLARKTMDAKQRLMRGIERINGLEVLRPSELSILVYRSSDKAVDTNAIAEALSERGWFVGRTLDPLALHLALNAVHAGVVDEYLMDLENAVREIRGSQKIGKHDDMTY